MGGRDKVNALPREATPTIVRMDRLNRPQPIFASIKVAAFHLGASSGAALLRRFERGIYPKEYLVHLTPRILVVDLERLIEWIRAGGNRP